VPIERVGGVGMQRRAPAQVGGVVAHQAAQGVGGRLDVRDRKMFVDPAHVVVA